MNEIKKANFNEGNLEKENLEWADLVGKKTLSHSRKYLKSFHNRSFLIKII